MDAPHDNPLDPASPRYTGTGSITGRITLVNFEESGISSVRISTQPPTVEVLTDSGGYYNFPAVASGTYNLVASKAGFNSDSTKIVVQTGHQLTVNNSLNAIPVITSPKLLTQKIDQWWPNPVYSAQISATVNDLNGIADIDSVWLSVDTLLFPMSYSISDRNFQLSLNAYQLPSNNIEFLVGKQLVVTARDMSKSTGMSAPFTVSRVIEDEATPDFPKFQDTTSGSPAFTWIAPNVQFLYSYSLNVVRVDAGSEVTVWTRSNIGSYMTSFQYPSTLPTGNYFWTIAVVDEYGNFSRSKESTFVVN